MKQLNIIRHGKSSWKEQGMRDFDRPLKQKGADDLLRLGGIFKAAHLTPEHVLCSAARRTTESAFILAEAMGYPKQQIETKEVLYLPPLSVLLSEIKSTSDQFDHLMIVIHEPCISALHQHWLSKDVEIVTGASTLFKLDLDSWTEAEAPRVISAYHRNHHNYEGFELTK